MTVHFKLLSKSESLLRLVREFAQGLGCTFEGAPESIGSGFRAEVPDGADTLLNLLTYVALGATKTGVDLVEPLCQVTYRQGATSEVTLGLRIAEFSLQTPAPGQQRAH